MCAESLARKGLAENRFHTLHVGHRQGRIEIVEDAPNRKADRPSVMIGSKSVEARSEVVANDDSLVALKILGHAAYPHPLLAYVPGKGSANHRCRPGGPSPLVSWVSQLTPWLTRAHVLSYPLPLVLCVVGSALTTCGCGCPPTTALCPPLRAVIINVTARGTTGAVNGAFLQVSGPTLDGASTETIPCQAGLGGSVCVVGGYAGKYDLEVGAPGFQTTLRTVTVEGGGHRCGCYTVMTEQLDVALVGGP